MKREIAQHLLDIKAVFLRPNEPFTWVSELRARSIVIIGLRSYPEIRKILRTAWFRSFGNITLIVKQYLGLLPQEFLTQRSLRIL